MRALRSTRTNLAALAVLAAAAFVGTPLVMGASRALATPEAPVVTAALRVAPVEAEALAPVKAEACLRKVRVVYGGYGTPAGCAAR